jgi:hypothetical protein
MFPCRLKAKPLRVMPATTNTESKSEKPSFPSDLTDWVEKQELLSWIVEDVDSLDWSNPELLDFLRANPAFQPRFLLVLLSFSYALGSCESGDVAELYFAESALRRIFPGQTPTAGMITRFRRDYRGLVKWCVAQAFKRAVRIRFALGDGVIPAGLRRLATDAAGARVDLSRHLDRSVQAE